MPDALGAVKEHLGQAHRAKRRGAPAPELSSRHLADFGAAATQVHDQAVAQAQPIDDAQHAVIRFLFPAEDSEADAGGSFELC